MIEIRPMQREMENEKVDADIVIVGGGLSGCALAAALAGRGRRIVILEARQGKNPRFNGELIHPTGVDVLDARGWLPALEAAGAAQVLGFAGVIRPGSRATLLPYREIPGSRPFGLGIDHRILVDVLRKHMADLPGVEVRTGERVTNVLREEERVVGVQSTSGPVRAHLVLAADGRHSKVRTLLGMDEEARLLSFTAAALLEKCQLPHPGFGHIFLGAWGPMLAYPISSTDARAIVDLPADIEKGTEAVIARIRNDYLPFVHVKVRPAMEHALDTGEIEVAANYAIYTNECTVPGAALVGDACGCSHPLTATGMTIALNDTRILGEVLRGIDLSRPEQVDAALARYQSDRYAYVRAREILADAVYEVFRGVDDGTRAIREGIFRYWGSSVGSRARSMALLSGHESRLPAFLREYVTVVGMSTTTVLRGAVNEPTLTGRVRSLVGLGKKTVEKMSFAARALREGNLRM
jgi:2-polyprenyl-6-methoxyphenol hydroxylase-like FAD-dependent oxidoreductase